MAYKDPEKRKEYARRYNARNKEKLSAANRRLYEANREKILRHSRANHAAHREVRNRKRKEYSIAHLEKERETWRRYRRKNPEKIAKAGRRYREKNRERIRERKRRYRENNREMLREKTARRRQRKRGLECSLTGQEWTEILERHFHRCHYCGCKSDKLHQEHKIPMAKGGGLTKENIVPACMRCNSMKGTSEYKRFSKELAGRLQLDLFEIRKGISNELG